MKDSYIVSGGLIVTAVIIGVFMWISSREIAKGIAQSRVLQPPRGDKQPPSDIRPTADFSKLLVAGRPSAGSTDAPITMIVCSDFQCPFCAKFAHEVINKLRGDFIKNGKLKVVFKHDPLPFHPLAQKASEAAECAHRQGKFWAMHDRLFSDGVSQEANALKSSARAIGLDIEKFNRCLENGETAETVRRDKEECEAAGVTGTPTIFINGKKIVGAQPYDQFKNLIAEAVKQSSK